jgi:hypothetical protein
MKIKEAISSTFNKEHVTITYDLPDIRRNTTIAMIEETFFLFDIGEAYVLTTDDVSRDCVNTDIDDYHDFNG